MENEVAVEVSVPSPEYVPETIQAVDDAASEFAAWREQGSVLAAENNKRQWAIGDWLLAGEERWQKKAYKEAEAIFKFEHATLKDFAYVSRNVPPSVRTYALPFAHHKLVADFHKNPEYQKELLAFAIEQKFSVDKFRRYLQSRNEHPQDNKAAEPSEVKPPEVLQITLPSEVLAEVKLFADANAQSIEETVVYLIRQALNNAGIKQLSKADEATEFAAELSVAEYDELHANEVEAAAIEEAA